MHPKLSDRMVLSNGLFFVSMMVIQFVPIASLAVRIAIAIVALVALAAMIVFVVLDS